MVDETAHLRMRNDARSQDQAGRIQGHSYTVLTGVMIERSVSMNHGSGSGDGSNGISSTTTDHRMNALFAQSHGPRAKQEQARQDKRLGHNLVYIRYGAPDSPPGTGTSDTLNRLFRNLVNCRSRVFAVVAAICSTTLHYTTLNYAAMPTFASKPHAPSASATRLQQLLRSLRQRPFLLFGMPFLSLMVVSSFALQNLTRTRYDYQSSKTSTMTMEEGLGMSKDRKRVDIREEYFVSWTPSPCRIPSPRSRSADEGELWFYQDAEFDDADF